jgi:hypothetical protein
VVAVQGATLLAIAALNARSLRRFFAPRLEPAASEATSRAA